MTELMYVLKCLALTAALILVSQIRVGGLTLEEKMEENLRHSKTSVWIQSAASGGALMITNATHSLKQSLSGGDNSRREEMPRASRAGR